MGLRDMLQDAVYSAACEGAIIERELPQVAHLKFNWQSRAALVRFSLFDKPGAGIHSDHQATRH
jgi:hypothetical protein